MFTPTRNSAPPMRQQVFSRDFSNGQVYMRKSAPARLLQRDIQIGDKVELKNGLRGYIEKIFTHEMRARIKLIGYGHADEHIDDLRVDIENDDDSVVVKEEELSEDSSDTPQGPESPLCDIDKCSEDNCQAKTVTVDYADLQEVRGFVQRLREEVDKQSGDLDALHKENLALKIEIQNRNFPVAAETDEKDTQTVQKSFSSAHVQVSASSSMATNHKTTVDKGCSAIVDSKNVESQVAPDMTNAASQCAPKMSDASCQVRQVAERVSEGSSPMDTMVGQDLNMKEFKSKDVTSGDGDDGDDDRGVNAVVSGGKRHDDDDDGSDGSDSPGGDGGGGGDDNPDDSDSSRNDSDFSGDEAGIDEKFKPNDCIFLQKQPPSVTVKFDGIETMGGLIAAKLQVLQKFGKVFGDWATSTHAVQDKRCLSSSDIVEQAEKFGVQIARDQQSQKVSDDPIPLIRDCRIDQSKKKLHSSSAFWLQRMSGFVTIPDWVFAQVVIEDTDEFSHFQKLVMWFYSMNKRFNALSPDDVKQLSAALELGPVQRFEGKIDFDSMGPWFQMIKRRRKECILRNWRGLDYSALARGLERGLHAYQKDAQYVCTRQIKVIESFNELSEFVVDFGDLKVAYRRLLQAWRLIRDQKEKSSMKLKHFSVHFAQEEDEKDDFKALVAEVKSFKQSTVDRFSNISKGKGKGGKGGKGGKPSFRVPDGSAGKCRKHLVTGNCENKDNCKFSHHDADKGKALMCPDGANCKLSFCPWYKHPGDGN